MDANTVNGILRAIVPALVAFAAGKGWISGSGAASVTDALVAFFSAGVMAIWSIKTNLPPSKT